MPRSPSFCSTKYDVRFPLFAKISVKEPGRHPLYRALIDAQPLAIEKPDSDFRGEPARYGVPAGDPTDVLWNFEKFLIGRTGAVVARSLRMSLPTIRSSSTQSNANW